MENSDPYVDNTIVVPAVPNPDVPEEAPDPLITSVFMKVSRAVDGDSHYRNRVYMALEMFGFPQSRANLVHITKEVAASIECRASGLVDTSRVDDSEIVAAMDTLPER